MSTHMEHFLIFSAAILVFGVLIEIGIRRRLKLPQRAMRRHVPAMPSGTKKYLGWLTAWRLRRLAFTAATADERRHRLKSYGSVNFSEAQAGRICTSQATILQAAARLPAVP
jgi:hypothetical protein